VRRASLLLFSLVLAACQSGAAPGATCARDSECATSLVCRLGRCRSACSENRDCPLGTQCFLVSAAVGACQLDVDRSCTASCPSGLTCLADQCLRVCSSAADCPTDGTCAIGSGASVGVCSDPRTDDAGPIATTDASADAGLDGSVQACRSVLHVCAGGSTVCAILDDRTVACWGYDINHQTGAASSNETTGGGIPYRSHPVLVVDEASVPIHLDQISCSDLHACGVTSDGHVLCWGAATTDLRADASVVAAPYATPAMFEQSSLTPWGEGTAPHAGRVAVGRENVCAMSVDRTTVRCWGRNQFGQVGNGAMLDDAVAPTSPTALLLPLTAPYVSLVMGAGITCITDATDHVACVGRNGMGELGTDVAMGTNAVTAVDPHVPARSLAAGNANLCGLDASGTAICVGANNRQQLGRTTSPDRSPDAHPGPVAGTTRFDSVSSGSMAGTMWGLMGSDVYAWGDNFRGGAALVPVDGVRPTPQRVAALSGTAEISADQAAGCAVSATHTLSCWGANDFAQLGQGAIAADDPAPQPVCIHLP
jgi:alpha-tubulin suppressor-like RCC1 family protein